MTTKLEGMYYHLLSQKVDFLITVYILWIKLSRAEDTAQYLLESTTGFHLLLHSLSC